MDWRLLIRKHLTWWHLFVVLLVLHLAPLWFFAYFPSQDGVSHIYNAHTLKEYHKHENYKMRDVFKLNITIFPNWMSHLVLAALLYIFPPLIAEKILLTFAIGLVPVSFFYFLNAIHGRGFLFGWLGFLFSYNYLLLMGFYNFALSISFFFLSFGYWWKHREDLRVKHVAVLYGLLLVTYLCHIVSYGLVLLAMSITAFCLWGSEAIADAWKERKTGSRVAILNSLLPKLKQLLLFAGYMLPAYFVLMGYYLDSLKTYDTGHHRGMDWISDYFWNVKSLVYFTDWYTSIPLYIRGWHLNLHHILLVVLGAAIMNSLVYRIRRRQWLQKTDPFLLITIIFTLMFIKAPWGFGPGGWINDRIHIYILLMLAAWLVPDIGKIMRYGLIGALVAICLVHLGRTVYDWARLDGEIAEAVSGAQLMEPHTVYSIRSPDWFKSDALGTVKYVTPFVHAMALYGLAANDIGHLANYEANYKYFPINYNGTYQGMTHYIVAWAYPEDETFADITPNYDIIYETKNLKLFRMKLSSEPDLSLWSRTFDERLMIRFDMQPQDGVTAEGYHAITQNTGYVTGRFGWVTQSPRHDFQGNQEIAPRDRDYVWDTDDAAFTVDVPNGTYRVINSFCSGEDSTHEVNILANDQPLIEKFIVPAGKETVEQSSTVTVTEGHLTQVIYTSKKRVPAGGEHNHWIWNSFTVEQLPLDF